MRSPNQSEVELRLKRWILAVFILTTISAVIVVSHVPRTKANAASGSRQHRGASSGIPFMSSAPAETIKHAAQTHAAENYGKLPLSFEPNVGQVKTQDQHHPARDVMFLSRGNGYTLFLGPKEAVLRLHKRARSAIATGSDRLPPASGRNKVTAEGAVVDMQLIGSRPSPRVVGVDELPGRVNYIRGNDPSRWRTNVPTYTKVKLEAVYPGIDLVYYGNQHQLEYDFVVAPGADPKLIRLNLKSQTGKNTSSQIDKGGDLVVAVNGGELQFHKPVVYQRSENDSSKTSVEGKFKLTKGEVTFEVGDYDRSKPLVIDPTLAYSTFLGGSNYDGEESFPAIAVDSQGNAYIAGDTDSTDFPVVNAFQPNHAPVDDSDAFVTKLNPSGTALVYSTYLGGSGEDWGTSIKVDSTGHAYVMGGTCSTDFPVTSGAFQTTLAGPCGTNGFGDLFITKFSPGGSTLAYSTYFGGSQDDIPQSIAIDSAGSAYVCGYTLSTDLPVTPGVFQPNYNGSGVLGAGDGFVAKFNTSGSVLAYSTYLGGSGDDFVTGVTVDSAGNAYLTGGTNSTDFPVTAGAFQTTFGGSGSYSFGDAVVVKLNSNATTLIYSTYLGGTSDDYGAAIAIDKAGNAYITGDTLSADFPVTPGGYQVVYEGTGSLGDGDAIVTKLNPQGSALVYSTYVGGDSDDIGYSIAVDPAGGAIVVGTTTSDDFPTTFNALRRVYGGGPYWGDGLAFRLSPNGSTLTYSTFIGGTGDDGTFGVAVGKGGAYITGFTYSPDFPVTPGAYDTSCGSDGLCDGLNDVFILKIKP